MSSDSAAPRILILNTLAFTICFAAWMLNGVLVTFLTDNRVFAWNPAQVGWLIGIPVLTGSILRLPIGILTDKFGGRYLFTAVMLASAVPMFLLSYAGNYTAFIWAGLGFGLAGTSFAVGVASTSLWFPKERQGTALGIFGIGNIGAALTSMLAPTLLLRLTNDGDRIEAWRQLPQWYAVILVAMAVIYFLIVPNRKPPERAGNTLAQRLAPLSHLRVWRFGLYYFLFFGGFVALSQWLIPYYLNVYAMSVATAGFMAALFSLPSGLFRALGGFLADLFTARRVMYIVLAGCLICCLLLIVPQMDIVSPGRGITAQKAGIVTRVSPAEIAVGDKVYRLRKVGEPVSEEKKRSGTIILPTSAMWQEPVVREGDQVAKRQLLARGVTHIFFQANIWVFTGLVFIVAVMMGLGMGAVFKHIPNYFPNNVGAVGGLVGVIGGLGGFFGPILFGYMLEYAGIWTTCWMFFAVLSALCLVWMHLVIQKMAQIEAPAVAGRIEHFPDQGNP